jgi:hypothetical protein
LPTRQYRTGGRMVEEKVENQENDNENVDPEDMEAEDEESHKIFTIESMYFNRISRLDIFAHMYCPFPFQSCV